MWTTKPFGKTQPASANASAIYELYHFYLQLPLSWEEFLQLIKCLNWRSETLGHMDIDEFIQDLQNTLNSCAFSKKTTPWLCTPVCVAFGSETDRCSSTPMKMLLVTTTKVNARSKAERVTSLFLRVGLTVRFIGMLQRCFHIWPSVDHPRIRSISWKPGTGTGEFSSSTNHMFFMVFLSFWGLLFRHLGKILLIPISPVTSRHVMIKFIQIHMWMEVCSLENHPTSCSLFQQPCLISRICFFLLVAIDQTWQWKVGPWQARGFSSGRPRLRTPAAKSPLFPLYHIPYVYNYIYISSNPATFWLPKGTSLVPWFSKNQPNNG